MAYPDRPIQRLYWRLARRLLRLAAWLSLIVADAKAMVVAPMQRRVAEAGR
jgi:hypothetical protein